MKIKITTYILIVLLSAVFDASRQACSQTRLSSELPILVLSTGGREILNSERIQIRLGVIDHGGGGNHFPGFFNHYDGYVNIEIRGSSSVWMNWPKRNYSFETQYADSSNRNVPLLGLPEENDWVLHGPYSDKSHLRNVLVFHLYRQMGRYAPRTKFCELILNDVYQGVYILMEKIKRDRNRVNISSMDEYDISGDVLTGGYLFKIDKLDGEEIDGWLSPYRIGDEKTEIFYQYHYPRPDNILPVQADYLMNTVTNFESMMKGDDWETYIESCFDVEAFIDFWLLNELAKNIDTWTFSTFFHKDRDSRGGRITCGPPWDYNLAFGNADYFEGWDAEGWLLERKIDIKNQIPFWLENLFASEKIKSRARERYFTLRSTVFLPEAIYDQIDAWASLIKEAAARNFEAFPTLGTYVWPNYTIADTWEGEVAQLKLWISDRIQWMDEEMAYTAVRQQEALNHFKLLPNFPNPFNSETVIQYRISDSQKVRLKIFNALGQEITAWAEEVHSPGLCQWRWNAEGLPGGLYFAELQCGGIREVQKMLLLR